TGNMIVSPDNAGNPWIGRSNLKSGIRYNNGTETGSREWSGTLIDHKAAAHTTGSDSAWKDDQEPLEASVDALGVLDALGPKSWTWVAENGPRIGQRGIGFIAQEVQPVLPEAVTGVAVSEGGEGLAIDTVPLVAVLWSAVRDLQAEVVRLKRDTRRRKP
ncbi:MAG: tail fiber domain-containing protein, partial [Paracoccus sp. (in: a-proteobacteria)]